MQVKRQGKIGGGCESICTVQTTKKSGPTKGGRSRRASGSTAATTESRATWTGFASRTKQATLGMANSNPFKRFFSWKRAIMWPMHANAMMHLGLSMDIPGIPGISPLGVEPQLHSSCACFTLAWSTSNIPNKETNTKNWNDVLSDTHHTQLHSSWRPPPLEKYSPTSVNKGSWMDLSFWSCYHISSHNVFWGSIKEWYVSSRGEPHPPTSIWNVWQVLGIWSGLFTDFRSQLDRELYDHDIRQNRWTYYSDL